MTARLYPPHTLRDYAFLADGERGALVGPKGDIGFMCAPRWHDDAVFSSMLGGPGCYAVTPLDPRFVWGGYYEPGTLIWRSRWVSTTAVVESREALAFPGDPATLVLLRRIEAHDGDAHVRVALECRAGFGQRSMSVRRAVSRRPGDPGKETEVWDGRTGDLRYRWSGVPPHAHVEDGVLTVDLVVRQGECHDLVLEVSRDPLPADPPEASRVWSRTERAWEEAVPTLEGSAAPGDARHSCAVLRGLTSATGGMVAAATTALPERAEEGRNYDYRYAWIRDQCYVGEAGATSGAADLVDAAVRFVTERVLDDGAQLLPAYTVLGGPVPPERRLPLPGYPGAAPRVGNDAGDQFQLDALGESLLLLAAADRVGRLEHHGWRAAETLVEAILKRGDEPDSGIWELEPRRWAHSRLMCAAGLRAVAGRRGGEHGAAWSALADEMVRSVERDCLHPDGRWQRSPEDPRVDAALLLPGIRGAVPPDDPRHVRTLRAVTDELADDGYVYRFRHDDRPLHEAEGAFLLSGFHLSLACLGQGRVAQAARWFERNRSALGSPGLFAEEYDVVQRQLRGNLPQAFTHALLIETAHELGAAGADLDAGFNDEER